MAIYQHYTITQNVQFLLNVLPQVQNIENFLLNEVELYGFIPADYSIWEESSDPFTGNPIPPSYFTFTQSMGYAGSWSAGKIESILGNTQRYFILLFTF
jgi:hypothetical protein